jgi:hypothetical protein
MKCKICKSELIYVTSHPTYGAKYSCIDKSCQSYLANRYSTEVYSSYDADLCTSKAFFIPISINNYWYYIRYYQGTENDRVQLILAINNKIICSFPFHPIHTVNEKRFYESYKELIRKACKASLGKIK